MLLEMKVENSAKYLTHILEKNVKLSERLEEREPPEIKLNTCQEFSYC